MKLYLIISLSFACLFNSSIMFAECQGNNLSDSIPQIHVQIQGYQKIPNVAQYKEASWENVVGVAREISVEEAFTIAESNSNIDYFFFTKGYQMVLENNLENGYRIFNYGDVVFFHGTPWWGSAQGLADGYIKIQR